MLGNTTFKSVM